jgi:hypothetical protein
VKAHVVIHGNKTADRLAKESTQNHHETQQNTKKRYEKRQPETKHKEVATSMEGNNESSGH